jgi:RNA chaperone Hfq
MATRTSAGMEFQDTMLGRLMERRQPATLYLRNRMSVRGRILDFDAFVILLEPMEAGPPHLVYKSAVVSISGPPNRPRPRHDNYRGPREPREPRMNREPREHDRAPREHDRAPRAPDAGPPPPPSPSHD